MKTKSKLKQWIIIGILGIVFQSVFVYAYDNNKVHPFVLTSKAKELLLQQYQTGKYDELKQFFNPTPSDINKPPTGKDVLRGTLGTIDADESSFENTPSFLRNATPLQKGNYSFPAIFAIA